MDIDFMNLSPDSQTELMNLSPDSQTELMNMMMQQMDQASTSTQTSSNYVNTSSTFNQISPNPTMFTEDQNHASVQAMREMIFRMAAMQPVHIDPESIKPPKRRNVKISKDPQSVAARHRRERISERIRILQRLVPGGTKMDTASMLDEAIHYVKFLRSQVQTLERAAVHNRSGNSNIGDGALGYNGYGYLGTYYSNNC